MKQTSNRLRNFLAKSLPALLALSYPFMAWKGLSVLSASPIPIVCVISESMAPAFHRGDILFLWNRSCVHVGDIPVIWFPGNPLPMVHRAIQVFNTDCKQDVAFSRWVKLKFLFRICIFVTMYTYSVIYLVNLFWPKGITINKMILRFTPRVRSWFRGRMLLGLLGGMSLFLVG